MPEHKALTALATLLLLASVVHAKEVSVLEWLQDNKETTRAAAVLKMLVTKPIAPNTKLTLLVPTNQVCVLNQGFLP